MTIQPTVFGFMYVCSNYSRIIARDLEISIEVRHQDRNFHLPCQTRYERKTFSIILHRKFHHKYVLDVLVQNGCAKY